MHTVHVPVATAAQVRAGWLGALYPSLVAPSASDAREATLRAEYRAAGLDYDTDRPAA